MRYWFFFSYARDDMDRYLEQFYRDLEAALRGREYLAPGAGEQHSFIDRENLQLMSSWTHDLMDALQRSRTFVCAVSPAYVNKQFCGKEYWIFDHRRRQGLAPNAAPPSVILPVIWIPVRGGDPAAIRESQFDHADLPEEYHKQGLLYLMKMRRRGQYTKCVETFAEALQNAGVANPAVPEFRYVGEFEDVPSAFESSGTYKAKFVFVAARRADFQGLPIENRYSNGRSCYWRPFNPPAVETVGEIAETVATECKVGYEDVPVDGQLVNRLHLAGRNDRILLVVDPWTLTRPEYRQAVQPVDGIQDPPSLVFAPLHDPDKLTVQERAGLDAAIAASFPTRAPEVLNRMVATLADLRTEISRALSAAHLKSVATAAEEMPATGTLPVVSAAGAAAAAGSRP